jgi:site-specific DNA recombinase
VSEELWQAAQEALRRNRRVSRNTHRRYLLKGIIRCGSCGLTYVGSQGRPGSSWYRCGGRQADRGPLGGACPSAFLRGAEIERQVWADIERFLRNPGDVLADLEAELGGENEAAIAEAERITLRGAITSLGTQRERVLGLAIRGHLGEVEAERELERIGRERVTLEARVGELEAPRAPAIAEGAHALLDEVRGRLDAGLTDEQRQEIVRLLVKITLRTDAAENGGKSSARAVVEYAFPKTALGVLQTRTGIREELNYTIRQRIIELPPSRCRAKVAAP